MYFNMVYIPRSTTTWLHFGCSRPCLAVFRTYTTTAASDAKLTLNGLLLKSNTTDLVICGLNIKIGIEKI